jgi:hypothetical protein
MVGSMFDVYINDGVVRVYLDGVYVTSGVELDETVRFAGILRGPRMYRVVE